MSQPRPQPAPPAWTPRRASAASAPLPGWNLPHQPSPYEPQHTRQWSSYILFSGITLLIGCLAVVVVALSR